MTDLAIFRLADALARHASSRHELVAKNIANADTPGYRARDLAPFSAEVREEFGARATRSTHLHDTRRLRFEPTDATAEGAAGPNGNDVSLSDQMARAASAMDDQGRALAIYGKTMDILRAGLGRK